MAGQANTLHCTAACASGGSWRSSLSVHSTATAPPREWPAERLSPQQDNLSGLNPKNSNQMAVASHVHDADCTFKCMHHNYL